MQTDDLIGRLTEDLTPRWSLRPLYWLGLACGALIAFLLFIPSLGIRPDFAQALHSVRFVFKFVVTLSLAAAAIGLLFPLSRPGATIGAWRWVLAAVPALLLLAVVAELIATPETTWVTRLVGSNALACSVAIPFLAAGPLACLLLCLRHGAPTRPGLTGSVAGLAASGIGATFYAAHCPDDSPLFVVTWYLLATIVVAVAGSLAGRRWLRW